jgi:hypothetical protein
MNKYIDFPHEHHDFLLDQKISEATRLKFNRQADGAAAGYSMHLFTKRIRHGVLLEAT